MKLFELHSKSVKVLFILCLQTLESNLQNPEDFYKNFWKNSNDITAADKI